MSSSKTTESKDTPTETEINKNTPLILPWFELAQGSSVLSEDTAAVILSTETVHKAPAWARGRQTKEKERRGKGAEISTRRTLGNRRCNPIKQQESPDWISTTLVLTAYINTINEFSRHIDWVQNHLLSGCWEFWQQNLSVGWAGGDVIICDVPRHRQSMKR